MDEIKKFLDTIDEEKTKIVNAAFAALFVLLFLLMPFYPHAHVAKMFSGTTGMVFGLLIILGMAVASAVVPFIKGKIAACINYALCIVTVMMAITFFYWGALTIVWLVIVVLPWCAFTAYKTPCCCAK